ncbi:LysM peptidoglycan-binding domain-containing protein [Kitasatospora sp. NPDC052896]|uniref:CIS tube protein n=1 Tax=Kitasatospora sp. NPDC052896 TaxID=3364061 RepID=UPI0037C72203
MTTAPPTKATLSAYEPPTGDSLTPGGQLGRLTFQFNPHTLTLSKSASWTENRQAAAESVGKPQFQGAGPRQLNVELFLDATADHDDSVATAVETLLNWCLPTTASISAKAPCAPWIRFEWGPFQSVAFFGYLASANATYSLFDTAGQPLRASCAIQITEAGATMPRQNPTSGALTARRVHQVVGGDSLELLAHREYGDATAWRVIAEANGIDDPMRLRPGTELLVPAAEELRAG